MRAKTNLEILKISRKNITGFVESEFSEVDEDDFAYGVNKLTKVSLCGLRTHTHLKNMFKAMGKCSNLKEIEIDYRERLQMESFCELKHIEPSLILQGIRTLDRVAFTGDCLNREQIEAFLASNYHEMDIKHLDISGNRNLPNGIDLHHLFGAFTKLESLNVSNIRTYIQATPFFTSIMQGPSNLRKLDISNNMLSNIDPIVLAISLNMIEDVNIENVYLTKNQVKHLFLKMVKSTKIEELNINKNILTSIEENTLALAINKLRKVSLESTEISTNQIVRIIQSCLEKSKLDLISLKFNPAFQFVPSSLVLKVERKIKKFLC